MAGYTIAKENISDDILREYFYCAKKQYCISDHCDLDLIFEVVLTQRECFPGIRTLRQQTPQNYIDRWVKNYNDARNNLPSSRNAEPKSSCNDPAIKLIVQLTQGLDASETKLGEDYHNLFMSAENIQGNLLEEYIAINVRAYGFLWCTGNILHAIDFCNTTGSCLLQIKNKSNTENSSSSTIRQGTSIEKWYRLGTNVRAGRKYPSYRWENLNSIINTYRTEGYDLPPCSMSEEDYRSFLKRIACINRNLITNL